MKKVEYKLMATDIDGTLVDKNSRLTDETIEAIRLAVGRGLIFTVCTGRSIQGVQRINELIGLDLPYITYNGAMVVMGSSKKILYEERMSPHDSKLVYDLGKKYDTDMIIWAENKLYASKIDEKTTSYGKFNNVTPILVENINTVVKNGVSKILWYDTKERIEKFEQELGAYLGDSINFHTSSPVYLEFVDKNASKAIALKKLGEHLGISRDETIAVGDGANDISMIEYAGLGVAMSNAGDRVKEKADYITLSNNENGVAHVIYNFILK